MYFISEEDSKDVEGSRLLEGFERRVRVVVLAIVEEEEVESVLVLLVSLQVPVR
jgi:hypothetical protein